jgi:hypothetical protein
MPTPANDLNITQAGYVVFDGTATFTGRTFQAGTGISLTNPDGIAGNTTISLSGGAVAIETINGDTGSITGNTVTIYADTAALNSGSTVQFVNSGTTSTLNVTNANHTTIIGNNSGYLGSSGTGNTVLGAFCLYGNSGGSQNTAVGYTSCASITSGANNLALGYNTLNNLLTGSSNIILGSSSGSAYTGSESSNILINNLGIVGESNVIRIGTQGSSPGQQNECFLAGIVGVTASNPVLTTINSSTGQMGVQALTKYDVLVGGASNALAFVGPGSAGQVLQSGGNAANPAYSTATYPATAGMTGNVLTSNGTNFISQAPASQFTPNSVLNISDDFNLNANSTFLVGSLAWTTGSNGSWLQSTGTATSGHPGVIGNGSLTSGNKNIILAAGTAGVSGAFILGGGVLTLNWVFNIVTASNSTNRYTLCLGIGDTVTTASIVNGCWLQYSDNLNSGNWTYNTASASTPTNDNSSTAVTTGWHNAQIVVNAAASSVSFSVDGVSLGSITTNIPSTGILPFLSIIWSAGTVAGGSINIDLFYLTQTLTTPR